MMVKVRASARSARMFKRMADIFRGRVIDADRPRAYTIELTGLSQARRFLGDRQERRS